MNQLFILIQHADLNLKKKTPVASTTSKKPLKKVWGSVTLPIFTFDVVTTDVTAHLLHQNNPKFKKHQWATVLVSNNEFEKTSEQVKKIKIYL